jgi:hypothetical protein
VDSASQRILLASIVELQGLYQHLIDPRNGNNPVGATAVYYELLERIKRWEHGEFYSKSGDSGTSTDSE